jgi:hypothetical protein
MSYLGFIKIALQSMANKNQILKRPVEFFKEYLLTFGTIEQDYVLININHFKRAQYGERLKEFLLKIEPYYHHSKKNYVTRPNLTYMNFITILRQISHMNGVFFEYKIKYTNSKHYIEYYFYLDRKIEAKETIHIET